MRCTRAFIIGVALAVTAPLAACDDGQAPIVATPVSTAPSAATPSPSGPGSSDAPAAVPPGKASAAPGKKPAQGTAKPAGSDLSALKSAGIESGKSVLIDVADDGVEFFLQVGQGGVVDFTGTSRTDDTMMALHPAPVSESNRVLIKPPFYDEEAGAGYCVADTPDAALKLEKCRAEKASQVWRVALAGDSGQFELHGAYGVIRVEGGRIKTSGNGRTGLQVLPYAS